MKKILMSAIICTIASGCSTLPVEQNDTKKEPEGKVYSIVKFEVNSSEIKNDETKLINNAKNILAHYPHAEIQLKGRASEDGTSDFNLILSEQRVESVRTKMENEGISKNKIKSVFYGEDKPLENPKLGDKTANRSVQVSVINK